VKATDVAVLLDDILDATELLLEDETARLDDELEDELAALLDDELDELATGGDELLPGDEPPQAANNKNEKYRPI
jgi:hypothetical protein